MSDQEWKWKHTTTYLDIFVEVTRVFTRVRILDACLIHTTFHTTETILSLFRLGIITLVGDFVAVFEAHTLLHLGLLPLYVLLFIFLRGTTSALAWHLRVVLLIGGRLIIVVTAAIPVLREQAMILLCPLLHLLLVRVLMLTLLLLLLHNLLLNLFLSFFFDFFLLLHLAFLLLKLPFFLLFIVFFGALFTTIIFLTIFPFYVIIPIFLLFDTIPISGSSIV